MTSSVKHSIHILVNSGVKVFTLMGLALALHGCSVATRHAVTVDSLMVDSHQALLTVSRVDSRVIQGADMHSATPLAARGEYYAVPLDFSSSPKKFDPIISVNTLDWIPKDLYYPGPASLMVDPVKGVLMPYRDRQGLANTSVFPSNNQQIFWQRRGTDGYAYADSKTRLLTSVSHKGAVCTIDLPAGLSDKGLGNNVDALILSNDGLLVAMAYRQGANMDVDLYKACKKVGHQTFSSSDRLMGLCVSGSDYSYVLRNNAQDVKVIAYESKETYALPGSFFSMDQRDIPQWPPVFECEKKKFYWVALREQNGDAAALNLYQYDPLTKEKSVVQLSLGSPLH